MLALCIAVIECFIAVYSRVSNRRIKLVTLNKWTSVLKRTYLLYKCIACDYLNRIKLSMLALCIAVIECFIAVYSRVSNRRIKLVTLNKWTSVLKRTYLLYKCIACDYLNRIKLSMLALCIAVIECFIAVYSRVSNRRIKLVTLNKWFGAAPHMAR